MESEGEVGIGRLFVPAVMAVEFVAATLITIVVPALEVWQHLYGDPILVGWVVTSFLLVSSVGAAICGRLGDLHGRARVMRWALVLCALGSVISACAPNLGWIIAGRAIQGVAGASQALGFGLLRSRLTPQRVPFAIGLVVSMSAFGTAFGFLIGGVMTEHFGPQSMFIVGGALAACVWLFFLLAVPLRRDDRPAGRVDWIGGLLLAPAIALILFAAGHLAAWTASFLIPSTLALGGLVLLVWAIYEWKAASPLIDLRLLGRRNAFCGNLVMTFAAIGVFQFAQLMTMMMQQPIWTGVGLGLSPSVSGFVNFALVGGGVAGAAWSGWLGGRAGSRLPMILGLAFVCAFTIVSVGMHHSVAFNLLAMLVNSSGLGIAYAAIPNVIISATPPHRTSEAIGVMTVLRAVSMAVGAQILAIVLAGSRIEHNGARFPSDRGFTHVLLFMSATCIAALVAALMTRSPPRPV